MRTGVRHKTLANMSKCKFNILVAACINYGIGYEGGFPWPALPNEMRHFRQLTQNGIVIMGRKTYNSIPLRNRPLPNRLNIVLSATTDASDYPPSVLVFRSLCDALQALDRLLSPTAHSLRYHSYRNATIWVIGGQRAYEEALTVARDRCHRIYYTHIYADLPADTFFPMHLVLDGDQQSMACNLVTKCENVPLAELKIIAPLSPPQPPQPLPQQQPELRPSLQQSQQPSETVLTIADGVNSAVTVTMSVVDNSRNSNNNHKYPIVFRQISVSEHSAPSSCTTKQMLEAHPNEYHNYHYHQQQQQQQCDDNSHQQLNQQLLSQKLEQQKDKQFTIPTSLQVEGNLCYEYRLYESVRL